MFKAHGFLAYLCILQFSSLVKSLPVQQSNPPSTLQVQNSTAIDLSAALKAFPVPATSTHELFPIPNSPLILDLQPRGGVVPESVESILLTADAWVARKISIFGPDTPSEYIWEYGTGEKPYTRLIMWSFGDTLTWRQLKTIIDGLWLFLVDDVNEQYTYWEIYDGEVAEESRIGAGAIVDADSLSGNPLIGVAPSNLTSKRAIQASSDIGLPILNTSQSLTGAIPFPIPASDMTLEFQSLGRSISPPRVNALLLIAAVAVDHDVDIHGENTPSAGEEFKYSLDQGVELWLVKIFRPPLGYMTYGRIRTVITGLQLYIVLGRRPQAVTFRVLSGADSKVLGYGAVGDLWPPDPPSNTISKRGLANSHIHGKQSSM